MKKHYWFPLLAMAAALLACGGTAFAATCSADADVSVEIHDLDLLAPYRLTVTNWSFSCQGLRSPRVSIGLSGSPSGDSPPMLRNTSDPNARIPVMIFKPGTGFSEPWTLNSPFEISAPASAGFTSSRIPAFSIIVPRSPDVPAGAYSGTIYMTFTYE